MCDEPTTALDVTTQAEIVRVLRELCAQNGMGMLFITHDLNLAGSLCDRLVVMKDGAVIEEGPATAVLSAPAADYTRRLVAATPRISGAITAPSCGDRHRRSARGVGRGQDLPPTWEGTGGRRRERRARSARRLSRSGGGVGVG